MGYTQTESAILAVLTADATFSAPLTGGIHIGPEMSRQVVPAAFDANNELQPCCLIKVESIIPTAVRIPGAGNKFINVLVYQLVGHDAVATCLDRAYQLLHEKDIPGAGAWRITFTDIIPLLPDDALSAHYGSIRFACTVNLA